jgi:hypothetical protein
MLLVKAAIRRRPVPIVSAAQGQRLVESAGQGVTFLIKRADRAGCFFRLSGETPTISTNIENQFAKKLRFLKKNRELRDLNEIFPKN